MFMWSFGPLQFLTTAESSAGSGLSLRGAASCQEVTLALEFKGRLAAPLSLGGAVAGMLHHHSIV